MCRVGTIFEYFFLIFESSAASEIVFTFFLPSSFHSITNVRILGMFFQSSVRPRQQEICGRWLSFFTLVRISGALRQLFRNFWIPQNDLWSHVPTITDRTKPPFVKHRQFLKSERFFFHVCIPFDINYENILLKSLIRICTISRLHFEGRRERREGE